MRLLLIFYFSISCFVILGQSQFNNEGWTLIEQRNSIKFYQKTESDIILLGCRFPTHLSAAAFFEKLQRVEEYTDWISGIDSVRRIPRRWSTDSAFSYQFFVEYLFLKKDGVANVRFSQEGEDHFSSKSTLSRNEFIMEDFDRVEAYRITWDFYQHPEGNIIEYTGLIDLPDWVFELIKSFILDHTEKTMLSLVSEY